MEAMIIRMIRNLDELTRRARPSPFASFALFPRAPIFAAIIMDEGRASLSRARYSIVWIQKGGGGGRKRKLISRPRSIPKSCARRESRLCVYGARATRTQCATTRRELDARHNGGCNVQCHDIAVSRTSPRTCIARSTGRLLARSVKDRYRETERQRERERVCVCVARARVCVCVCFRLGCQKCEPRARYRSCELN